MKKKILLLLIFMSTFIGINIVNAVDLAGSTLTFKISGKSTIAVGEQADYILAINSNKTPTGAQGSLDIDTTYLDIISITDVSTKGTNNVTEANKNFIWYMKPSTVAANEDFNLVKITVKGKTAGTTHIKMVGTPTKIKANCTDSSVTSGNPTCATINSADKEITIGGSVASSSSSTSQATSSSSTSNAASSSSSSSSTPAPSTNAKPANIQVSGYTMSPSFNADTLGYTVTVPESATYVNIVVTKGETSQTVSGDGNFTLTGDTSTAKVTITAADGSTKKEYTITIKKQASAPALDGDNTLKDLTIGGTTITGFDKDKTNYSIDVGDDVTSINVAGIPTSSTSTVSISGGTNLQPGKNTVTVTVTAQDGSTRVYTINVTKPSNNTTQPTNNGTTATTKKGDKSTTTKKPSSDTGVKDVVIGSPHTISPKFSNDVDVYNVTVPYDVESLDLTMYLNDSKATYTVTGNENFQVGKINVVTVKVKAEDGTTRTIIFNVTRTTDEDGTKLTDIGIGGGYNPQPGFDPDILGYTINVPGSVDKLDLNPKAPEGSTVKTYGNENLKEGWNTILVTVTDKNGYTRTYTLSVYKEPKKILGLTYRQFAIVAGIIGGLLLTFFLILLLLARRRKKDEVPVEQAPIIDFKPEFNFGSRNGTDDDTVYPNGILNQDSTVQKDVDVENADAKVMKALNPTVEETPIVIPTHEAPKEIPYDPYDEIVTKDELIDAIEEGLETKNPEKLKMLLEQEELNRKKEELKRKNGGR